MYHIEIGWDNVNGVELVRACFMSALLNLQHLEQGMSWPVECYINFLRKTVPWSELLAAFACCTVRHYSHFYSYVTL